MKLKLRRRSIAVFFLAGALSLQAQQTSNITFQHEGLTVYGSLTLPSGPGPFPAIVIVPGTGAIDRDGTISMSGGNVACLYPGLLGKTLRIYKDLGDPLAAAGYAVLRYNKIEYNYTTPQTLGPITFEKLWFPFRSGIEYVRKRPEVDSTSIILIGHSEGSALIPIAAKNRSDIKALISVAGARTPFDSLLCRQIIDITQLCGGNMQQAQSDVAQVHAYFASIRDGSWNGSTPPLLGVPAAVWSDYVTANDPVVQNYHDCILPTLFLGMGDDFNVPPSELTRFKNEIQIPADFWTIPGANHYMTYSATPTVAKAVPDTIIYWLSKLNLVTGVDERGEDASGIDIFPNPVKDMVQIKLPGTGSAGVSDITGRKLISFEVGESRQILVDMSVYSPGVYFVRYQGKEGVRVRKIVKS